MISFITSDFLNLTLTIALVVLLFVVYLLSVIVVSSPASVLALAKGWINTLLGKEQPVEATPTNDRGVAWSFPIGGRPADTSDGKTTKVTKATKPKTTKVTKATKPKTTSRVASKPKTTSRVASKPKTK